MSGKLLVAREVRKDLAAAQAELERAHAETETDPAQARARITAARKHIAEAMRRLG